MTFINMMVRHPEIAKKAQVEIDEAIGNDRLPTLQDRVDLPYTDCILKEVLRYDSSGVRTNTFLMSIFLGINPAVPLGQRKTK